MVSDLCALLVAYTVYWTIPSDLGCAGDVFHRQHPSSQGFQASSPSKSYSLARVILTLTILPMGSSVWTMIMPSTSGASR